MMHGNRYKRYKNNAQIVTKTTPICKFMQLLTPSVLKYDALQSFTSG